jgi:predicted O-methyltransferase YrrM
MTNISSDNTKIKRNIYYKIYFFLFYYFLSIKKKEKLKNRPIHFFLDSKSIVSDFFSLKLGIKNFVGNDIFEKVRLLEDENSLLLKQLAVCQEGLEKYYYENKAITEQIEKYRFSFEQIQSEFVQQNKVLKEIQKQIRNSALQAQASAAVQFYLQTGELLPFHVETDSWPIAPDFAFTLIRLLETNDYDLVVEFGSGFSTVLVASSLAKLDLKRQGKLPTRFLSFDHLPEYLDRTCDLLRQAGLDARVELFLAPLADYLAPNGCHYPYYACQERLLAFAGSQSLSGLKVLAIVDGPPQATCEHARYPAGPLLAQVFREASIDILLDDLIREDEKQVAKMWEEEFRAAGRTCESRILKLQKVAYLLRIAT